MRFLSKAFPIIIAVFCAALALSQSGAYPQPPQGIAAEKYAGFSGVLTIFVSDSAKADFPNIERWLTEITNLFEKSNRGIYLRCTDSDASADIRVCTRAEIPVQSILPVGDFQLLPAFSGSECAVPVAADGYVLGINGDIPATLQTVTAGWNPALALPWIALCEQFSPISTQKSTVSAPEIGLIPVETPEPTAPPAQGTLLARENLIEDDSDVLFSRFLAGEIDALPLTGAQTAKIRAGQAEGRWPGIRLLNAGAYTDKTAYAVIPQSVRKDADGRTQAARAFLQLLLGDESQQRLKRHSMFPTVMTMPVYEGAGGMAQIEAALRRSDLVLHATVGSDVIDDFLRGVLPARAIMRQLRNAPGG